MICYLVKSNFRWKMMQKHRLYFLLPNEHHEQPDHGYSNHHLLEWLVHLKDFALQRKERKFGVVHWSIVSDYSVCSEHAYEETVARCHCCGSGLGYSCCDFIVAVKAVIVVPCLSIYLILWVSVKRAVGSKSPLAAGTSRVSQEKRRSDDFVININSLYIIVF